MGKFFRRCRRRIHPVDRSLMVIMLILLLQSVGSLFLPDSASQTATTVDVVIRTASAAIFGYLLGGNFGKESSVDGQTQSGQSQHMLKESVQSDGESTGIQARIGFQAESDSQSSQLIAEPAETCSSSDSCGTEMQILVAAAIGLFCLIALLVLRNLSELGIITELSDSATATVIQFRDFVSGCVGFLIGNPTHSAQSNS